MKVIVAEQLTKIFPGGKKALNSVSFAIEEGEIFGFLGPNGAGKTTAVKLLNGILQPTDGSCSLFGSPPEKAHAISGVVTEHAQMYNNLTGLQNLVFFGELFGIAENEAKRRALEIMEILSLIEAKDQKLSEYSTGMRQRLSLARAMIHQPKILFLDEPTSGLDPESSQNVNNLIKSLARDKGITVFLCTHQLRYAEEICTKYGLISEGNMLASGSLDELHSLVFSGLSVMINDKKIDVDSYDEIPMLVKQIVDSGGKVYNVVARKHSLEEIYFAIKGGK